MTITNTREALALMLAFAVALTMMFAFTVPAFASDHDDENKIVVVNKNYGKVKNVVVSKADSGDNWAGGASGGNGGNGGSVTNNGDDVDDTTTGNGGAGGNANGADSGGFIQTGAAGSVAAADNTVNTNDVRITRDCGCDGKDVVINKNRGKVKNIVISKADSGDNDADGASGGNGGHGGSVNNSGGDDVDDTDTGNGGNGGAGGEGGTVLTGDAISVASAVTVLNRNIVRITRTSL